MHYVMILRSSYKIKLYSDMFRCWTPTIIGESALYKTQHRYCKLSYNARAVRSTLLLIIIGYG